MPVQSDATWSMAVTDGGTMRLADEFECATTPLLRSAFMDRTRAASEPAGDFDLTAVSFADSTLVHFLYEAGRKLSDRRPPRVVVQAGSDVERLMALTGADRQLDLVTAL